MSGSRVLDPHRHPQTWHQLGQSWATLPLLDLGRRASDTALRHSRKYQLTRHVRQRCADSTPQTMLGKHSARPFADAANRQLLI